MNTLKKIILYSALLITLTTVCTPDVSAQTTQQASQYTVLTPLPGIQDPSGRTTLETYLPALFRFSIGIAAIMAFVMITFGGIIYSTSDALSNKSQGREYITNAIVGLLLVIGAWAILYTINPQILNFSLITQNPTAATTPTTPTTPTAPPRSLQPRMTSAVIGMRAACNCNFTITSETGGTHNTNSLHYQGLAIDTRANPEFNKYITGNTAAPAACATFGKTINGISTRFLWEPKGATCGGTVPSTGDHWHISTP